MFTLYGISDEPKDKSSKHNARLTAFTVIKFSDNKF